MRQPHLPVENILVTYHMTQLWILLAMYLLRQLAPILLLSIQPETVLWTTFFLCVSGKVLTSLLWKVSFWQQWSSFFSNTNTTNTYIKNYMT